MITISSLEGNTQKLDGGSMFGNAPRMVWQRWIAPDDRGRIPLACRSMLIKIDEKNILCETGVGNFFEPHLADRYGVQSPETYVLGESLTASGVDESDIDFVILSHLHFDHAGGLLPNHAEMSNADFSLRFPNARYVVGAEAWQRAQNPHSRDRASFVPAMIQKLIESDRLLVVQRDQASPQLPKEIDFFYSDGHTPGQMLTVVRGSNRSAIFTGDLIPGIPWVHLPITMGYDRYPELLIDEKQELYNTSVNEQWLHFYTHDPKHCASFVQKNEKGKYEAISPFESLNSYEL